MNENKKVVHEARREIDEFFWQLLTVVFFIALCFLKNMSLIEPQKYLWGSFFRSLIRFHSSKTVPRS